MPSPVPAGFTRGPILFLASPSDPVAEARLLQRYWQEAGAYGARIVVVCVGGGEEQAGRAAALFAEWESDSVARLDISMRAHAHAPETVQAITAATAVLLCGDNPLRLASLLGGTPLAQAIRRANAQNKAVGSIGRGAPILCQHMVTGTVPSDGLPFLCRNQVQFAPGMGIVNRLVLDFAGSHAIGRLLAAIAYNPFLSAAALDADAGAVIYPNSTMEAFGDKCVVIADGSQVQETNLSEVDSNVAVSLVGVKLHVLGAGCTFNFDTRQVTIPHASELSLQTEALRAAF